MRLYADPEAVIRHFEQVTRSSTLGFPFLQPADAVPHLTHLLRRTDAGERKVWLLGMSFSSLQILSMRTRGKKDLSNLRSLRGMTLSPELTEDLLAAVIDQVASITPSRPAIERWQQLDPHLLLKMTRMSECGQ